MIYLKWLKEYSQKSHLEILAYCLMTNHVHLAVIPKREDGLQAVFKPLHMRYEILPYWNVPDPWNEIDCRDCAHPRWHRTGTWF